MSSTIKVFISYSHADQIHKQQLKKYLSHSLRDGSIEVWDDEELHGGEELDAKIKENLSSSDIVIFLVSQDFIASSYCYDVELLSTLSAMKEKGVSIFPIIVDHCVWKKTHLKKYLVLPKDGGPISEYENSSKAWLEVVQKFDDVVDLKKKEVISSIKLEIVEKEQERYLKSEYGKYLREHEVLFQNKNLVEEITLENLFVWPDFSVLSDDIDDEFVSSEEDFSSFEGQEKIIVVGDEQTGKTCLAKKICTRLDAKGFFPVLLNAEEIKKSNVQELVDKFIRQNTTVGNNHFYSIEKNKKYLIIDDFDKIGLNLKAVRKFLDSAYDFFGGLIVFSSKTVLFESSVNDFFENFSKREIKILGHYRRSLLINNWNSLGVEEVIEENELWKKNDFSTKHINSILKKNIVPAKPIYIVMLLQTLESSTPSDFSLTSYGHCYNNLIQKAFERAKVNYQEMDIVINYVTELAFYMYESGGNKISKNNMESFCNFFSKKYLISTKEDHDHAISILIESGVLFDSGDYFKFSYKYIYYFYVAKYIASRAEVEAVKLVGKLCEKLHSENNANIIIFVTYHTKNKKIIDEIILHTVIIFDGEDEATLSISETQHLYKFSENIPDMILEQKDVQEERTKKLKEKDEADKKIVAARDDVEEENENEDVLENTVLSDINRSLRAIEIVGQILRNHYGSMERSHIKELADSAINVGLRFLGFYLKITKDMEGDLISIFQNILQNFADDDPESANKKAKEVYWGLCYGAAFYILKKIGGSIGNERLLPIYLELSKEKDTSSMDFVSLLVEMEFSKSLPKRGIEASMVKTEKNAFANRLLKHFVINYVYSHKISYQDKDWIATKLNITQATQKKIEYTSKKIA